MDTMETMFAIGAASSQKTKLTMSTYHCATFSVDRSAGLDVGLYYLTSAVEVGLNKIWQ